MITSKIDLDLEYLKVKADLKVPSELGRVIMHHLHIARDRAMRLFWYDKGVYRDDGEEAIWEIYHRILEARENLEIWRSTTGREVVRYISVVAPTILEQPKLTWVNLTNGIYDWDSATFYSHSPKYLTTVRIPITYDANATCPTWDKFLDDILPVNGGGDFLAEVIGLCMIPLTSLQKSIILVGSGSNGKSTFLNGLVAAVGSDNCCHISLQQLGNPNLRFVTSRLLGKLVNVVGDLPAKKIEDTSTIKEITGEDTVEAEFKGRNGFRFIPFARLIFACNEVVRSDDDSEGYKRRFIHVPFTQKFAVDPNKGRELADELSSPKELSGLFNRIAMRLPSIAEEGFTITPEIASIIDNWLPINEDAKKWFKEKVELDPNGKIPTGAFYNYWIELCPYDGVRSRGKLITFMKMLFPGIDVGKVCSVAGRSIRCYTGVRMADPITQRALEVSRANEIEVNQN